VCAATRPEESVIIGTVASLPERLASAELHGPVLVLIGRTLADVALPQTADMAATR
jgi:siroheme synthase